MQPELLQTYTQEDVIQLLEEIDQLKQDNYKLSYIKTSYYNLLNDMAELQKENFALEQQNKFLKKLTDTMDSTLTKIRGRLLRITEGAVPIDEIYQYVLYVAKTTRILG
jgi:hypothetical protein